MKIRDNSEQFENNNEKTNENDSEKVNETKNGKNMESDRLPAQLGKPMESSKLPDSISQKDQEKTENLLSEKMVAKIRKDYPGIPDEIIEAIRTKDNYKKLNKMVKEDAEERDFLEPDHIYESGGGKIAFYTDDKGNLYRVNDRLMPCVKYEINGYQFITDKLGRIILIRGSAHVKEWDGRKTIKDSIQVIGHGDEKKTDDRGHGVADLLGGPNGMENMFPQDANINRGDYKKFEKRLVNEVKAGKEVYITVQPVYKGDSYRPKAIVYTAVIDGEKEVEIFPNGGNKNE